MLKTVEKIFHFEIFISQDNSETFDVLCHYHEYFLDNEGEILKDANGAYVIYDGNKTLNLNFSDLPKLSDIKQQIDTAFAQKRIKTKSLLLNPEAP